MSDFSYVIINISKIVLIDTNFGLHFLVSIQRKSFILEMCVQVKSAFQISDFISMVKF